MTLDRYTIWARMAPVFVAAVPLVFAAVAFAPESLALEFGIGTAVVSTGLSALVAHLGRDFGLRKEKTLWTQWGGPPTTRFLRHRDTRLNVHTKSRYHLNLRNLLPSLPWPDADQEMQDPKAADAVYQSAVDFLLARTRDAKAFPLILQENISYGFRRNLWGLKRPAIALAVLVALFSGVRLCRGWGVASSSESVSAALATGTSVALILVWWRWARRDSVRRAAEGYARRLLESAEVLQHISSGKED